MVNYRNYLTDPQKVQNALYEAAKFREKQRKRARKNAFAEQEDNIKSQGREIELIEIQAELIGRALDSVKGEKSWKAYRSWLQRISQTPLGQSDFFQQAVLETPPNYDPAVVKESKRLVSVLGVKTDEGESGGIARWPNSSSTEDKHTLSQKLDDWRSDFEPASELPYDPEYTDRIKEGPDDDPDFFRNQLAGPNLSELPELRLPKLNAFALPPDFNPDSIPKAEGVTSPLVNAVQEAAMRRSSMPPNRAEMVRRERYLNPYYRYPVRHYKY